MGRTVLRRALQMHSLRAQCDVQVYFRWRPARTGPTGNPKSTAYYYLPCVVRPHLSPYLSKTYSNRNIVRFLQTTHQSKIVCTEVVKSALLIEL